MNPRPTDEALTPTVAKSVVWQLSQGWIKPCPECKRLINYKLAACPLCRPPVNYEMVRHYTRKG